MCCSRNHTVANVLSLKRSRRVPLVLGILVLVSLVLSVVAFAHVVAISPGVAATNPLASLSTQSIGPSPPLFFDSPTYPGYPTWTTVNGQSALQLTPVASGAYAGVAWHALGYTGQPVEVSLNGTYTQVSGAGLADGFKIIMFAQNGTGSLSYGNNTMPGISGPGPTCGSPSSTGIAGSAGVSPNSTSPYFSLNWDPFYSSGGQFNLWVINPSCNVVANPGGIGCTIGQPAAFDTIRFNTTYTPNGDALQARVSDLTSGTDCSFTVGLSQYGFNAPSPGTYWAMILGANGGGYADWTLLQVEVLSSFDFSLSNSGDIRANQGGSGQNSITVTLISGATQPVALSVGGLPNGASAGFSGGVGCGGQPTCTISPTVSAILTITTSSSTPCGQFTVTVTGNGGALTRTTSFTMTITSCFDFAMSNSGGITVTQGGSGSNTITVTLVTGTTQGVTLSVSGLPSGASSGFSGGSGCGGLPTCIVSPTISATLRISTSLSTPSGCYAVTVTGKEGGLTHTTAFPLNVAGGGSGGFDFCLSNSGDITVSQGGSGSNTITVTLVSGSAQSVTLSVSGLPSGATPRFSAGCGNQPTCIVTPNPTTSHPLTITTLSSTPLGPFTITVTGDGGGLTRATSFKLCVRVATQLCVATQILVAGTTSPDVQGTTQPLGTSVYDTAILTASPFSPTGNVTYYFYSGSCIGTPLSTQSVTMMNTVPNSAATGMLMAGSYSFQAVYGGDSNYNPSTGACEPFTVIKADTTTSTTLFFWDPQASSTTLSQSTVEPLGYAGYDTANAAPTSASFPITGGSQCYPTYSTLDCPFMHFDLFTNGNCIGTPALSDDAPVTPFTYPTVGNGASPVFGPMAAGNYSFRATYTGFSNYDSSTSACEPFTILKANTATASQIVEETYNLSIKDTSTIASLVTSSAPFTMTGNVIYYVYSGDCPGTLMYYWNVTLSGGTAPGTGDQVFVGPGSYSFQAVYSGDSNYNGSTGPCETMTVTYSSGVFATKIISS
jgi:hypothetical protein